MSGRPGVPVSPEAVLAQLADAVEARAEPLCRHFGECGGCQLQHLPYAAQCESKKEMLQQVLASAGLQQLPSIETHTAEPWQYRNRIRLRVVNGAVGYSRRASHDFLPISECPIAAPRLLQVAFAMQSLVQTGTVRWPEKTAALELFSNADESAIQVSLQLDASVSDVSRAAPDDLRRLCQAVQKLHPAVIGGGITVSAPPDRALSRRIQESQRIEIARWGAPQLPYNVGDATYNVTRTAFFQVNRFLTDAMVTAVLGNRTGRLAFDLYAGAGLFSVPLAGRFQQVIAVEVGEPAATDLAAHMATAGGTHQAVRATVQGFLQNETRTPDLVVLDPPRAGLGPLVIRALVRTGAAEIVYVSCDAGTFARDARALVESGYTLAELHFFDLFPQTFHTETVAIFRR